MKENFLQNESTGVDLVEFSIVIISYKHDIFFMDALKSILNQKYERTKMELIVVCKSYGTPINFLKTQDVGINLKLVIDDNFRPGPKLRKAIEVSKFDWIVILDDDDLWHPYKLAILSSYILKEKTVVYVHNSKVYINENYSVDQIKVDLVTESNIHKNRNFLGNRIKTSIDCEHNGSSIAFNKSMIKKDLEVLSQLDGAMDTFLYLSARGQESKYLCISEKLTYFRVKEVKSHPSSSYEELSENLLRQLNSYKVIQNLHRHTPYTLKITNTRMVTNEIKLILILHSKKNLREKAVLVKKSLQLKYFADSEGFFLTLLALISMASAKLANHLYSFTRNNIKQHHFS